MPKAKLKQALEQFKGVDHKLERQKKLQKQAEKRKRSNAKRQEEEGGQTNGNGKHVSDSEESDAEEPQFESEDEEDIRGAMLDIEELNDSASSSSEDEAIEGAENDDDEEDIPLSDIASIASEEKGDIVPHQRLTINNTTALLAAHKRIALPISKLSFSTHQSITTTEPVAIEDVEDDLTRELAFYAQSLSAVKAARALLKAEGNSFARPTDYFAEMVKSDEHMGRVKAKLVDAAAGKKAASEARRQRDLKKFGKQVQVAKLQERDKAKRETLDNIKLLKRKRASAPMEAEREPDLFDVELEDTATTMKKDREERKSQRGGANGPNKRRKKDEKFGFGGKKRFAKSNDTASSADTRDYSLNKMRGKTGGRGAKVRPGKARRAAGRP